MEEVILPSRARERASELKAKKKVRELRKERQLRHSEWAAKDGTRGGVGWELTVAVVFKV